MVTAKVIEVGDAYVTIEVIDGRRAVHCGHFMQKGQTVTLPLALTLFEEFQG